MAQDRNAPTSDKNAASPTQDGPLREEGKFLRIDGRSHQRFQLASRRNADTQGWLLTYTDILTLLITMFIVLLANSTMGKQKPQEASANIPLYENDIFSNIISNNRSFGVVEEKSFMPIQDIPDPRTAPPQKDSPRGDTKQETKESLQKKLEQITAREKLENAEKLRQQISGMDMDKDVDVDILPTGVNIRIGEEVLFDTGEALLQTKGQALFDSILPTLNEGDFEIIIEGHTDSVPINTARFPSNWELSAARAISVVQYLVGKGVDPRRLRAVGRADTRPIATNENAAGRARNRRVNVLLDM